MQTLEESPEVQWFDPYATCRMCGKKSEGTLRGRQNQSYGDHCRKCADKRIAGAKRVRKQLSQEA